MKIVEQHKLILDLKDYASRMSRSDQYDFEMFQKRDKDDEELDGPSFRKLEDLHGRYVVKKSRKDIESLFKKLTDADETKKE